MANTTTIQQSGINFTVDNRVSQYQGWNKKYANSNNKGDVYPADPNDIEFGINAIEIDWNGAQWSNITGAQPSTINTTGELTKEFYSPMFAKAA